MLAVSMRTKRSSTQRRHRASSSAETPPLPLPRPNLGAWGCRKHLNRCAQGQQLGKHAAAACSHVNSRHMHLAAASAQARLHLAHGTYRPRLPPPPGARPAASSSAASALMIALLSTATRCPSIFTTGTWRLSGW